MKTDSDSENLTFVIGAEKRLEELLTEEEVLPLLNAAVRAGATGASITDPDGTLLWTAGTRVPEGSSDATLPLHLEGEVVGHVRTHGVHGDRSFFEGLSELLCRAVATLIYNNLKRMLTTETHTTVVNQSYQELLETNRKLRQSERNYRDLAKNLETKVEERTEELKKAYARLFEQEKVASVGQLAAGVAHEINNPLGFILSNLHTLQKYCSRVGGMLREYRAAVEDAHVSRSVLENLHGKWDTLKIDHILSDEDALLRESISGADRVKKIVSDLKGFSHIDDLEETVVDINHEIDKTLNVLSHEIPQGTVITRDYHPLPGFTCHAAMLCQVFLNILMNSLQARREGLEIGIHTAFEGAPGKPSAGRITIRFSDNGPGIPDEIRPRIFEPFFTTREVGKGKGLGLTLAFEIVTGHGGTIEVESRPGQGTAMVITLPAKRM